jgi:hypothetical protein
VVADHRISLGDVLDGTADGLADSQPSPLPAVGDWSGRSPKPGRGASPNTDGGISLLGVAATSPSNVWAVGGFRPVSNAVSQVLAIHCC